MYGFKLKVLLDTKLLKVSKQLVDKINAEVSMNDVIFVIETNGPRQNPCKLGWWKLGWWAWGDGRWQTQQYIYIYLYIGGWGKISFS